MISKNESSSRSTNEEQGEAEWVVMRPQEARSSIVLHLQLIWPRLMCIYKNIWVIYAVCNKVNFLTSNRYFLVWLVLGICHTRKKNLDNQIYEKNIESLHEANRLPRMSQIEEVWKHCIIAEETRRGPLSMWSNRKRSGISLVTWNHQWIINLSVILSDYSPRVGSGWMRISIETD